MGLHQALAVLHRSSLKVSANTSIQVAFPLCFHPLMNLSASAVEIPSDGRICSSPLALEGTSVALSEPQSQYLDVP